jgi:preprotein translocase subunit YajC
MGGFDYMALLPFVLIFGVFYFLILRPQQQKMKKHQELLAGLRRGDRVVTSGGLIGTISKIVSDGEVQLELSENVRVRLVRATITEVLAKTDPVTMRDSGSSAESLPSSSEDPKTEKPKTKAVSKTAANRSAKKAKE